MFRFIEMKNDGHWFIMVNTNYINKLKHINYKVMLLNMLQCYNDF